MKGLEVLLLLDGVVEAAVADPLHPGVHEGAALLGPWRPPEPAAERRRRHLYGGSVLRSRIPASGGFYRGSLVRDRGKIRIQIG